MIRLPLVLAFLAATPLAAHSLIEAADEARPAVSSLPDIPASVHAAMQSGDFEDRGRESRLVSVPPPSEPYVRFSRIRLSGQSGPSRD
jgi:hypothetical protein